MAQDLKVALVTKLKDYLSGGLQRIETRIQSLGRKEQDLSQENKQLRQEFNKLKTEVKQTDSATSQFTQELDQLGDTAQNTSSKLSLITKGIKGIGAVGGTALITGAVKGMFELDRWTRRVIFNTSLTSKEKAKLTRDIANLRSQTLASYEEIAGVLTKLIQETGRYDQQTVKTARSILMLKDLMAGWDEGEITRAITQMQKAWNVTGDQAAQIIYTIYQKAGDKAGDLLDTFWEYAPALAEAGIEAEEFAAIMIAGAKEGAFNYDRIANSMKEALRARLVEAGNLQQILGDVESQQAGLIDQLWGEGSEEWTKMKSSLLDYIQAVQKGDKELAKRSFVRLIGITTEAYKKDAIKTKELLESIFGAMGAEDLATDVLKAIGQATSDPEKYLKGAKELQKSWKQAQGSLQRLQIAWTSVWQNIIISVQPFFDVLTKGLNFVAEFAQEHKTLSTMVVGSVAVIGSLGLAIKGLSLAFGVAKSGLMTFLTPFRLFKKESLSACTGAKGLSNCLMTKGKALSTTGGRLKVLSRTIGGVGGKVLSLAGRFRFLAGAGKFLLGGLRLLSLTNPLGLAITGVTILGPKLWKLIGGVEGIKKAFSKVGNVIKTAFQLSPIGIFLKGLNMIKNKAPQVGKALLNGVKGVWAKAKSIGSSILAKGIRSIPVIGAGYELGRTIATKFVEQEKIKEISQIPATQGQVNPNQSVSVAPNISITIPSVSVTGGEAKDVQAAVLNAVREGGEEMLSALEGLIRRFMERDSREL